MSPHLWKSGAAEPSPVVDSAEVAAVKFQATKFREGYVQDEVDAFLDRVVMALDEHHRGAPLSLTADDVLNRKFQRTKFTEGYDQDEVDDFLDRVVSGLRAESSATGAGDAKPIPVLDSAQVRAVTFKTTRFREGYARDVVDDLLERAAVALDERLRGVALSLTADDVLNVKFQRTKFKEGYDQHEVDDFLDRIVSGLRAEPPATGATDTV